MPLTATASFTITAANVQLALTASDPAAPLTVGSQVTLRYQLRHAGQAWATPGLLTVEQICVVGAVNLGVLTLPLPLTQPLTVVRVQAQIGAGVPTAWSADVTYTPAAVSPLTTPGARTVSYKQVADGLKKRMGYTGTMTLEDNQDLAEYLGSAYRVCLEHWDWNEAHVTAAVPCTQGLVQWSDLQGADFATFSDADPDAVERAYAIEVKRQTAEGWLLRTDLTQVWARFTPRAPTFAYEPLVSATSYGQGAVGYHEASGHMVECIHPDGALGSEVTDPSRWRQLPLLWILVEPTKSLALADSLGDGEHERAQAAVVQAEAAQLLADAIQRQRA
jgi:hypothetical protein